MAPLAPHVVEAIAIGARPAALMPGPMAASTLADSDEWPIETGWTVSPDRQLRVFCCTPMPDVSPADWAWWFGWHGSDSDRYRLWHPRAHVAAAWADGGDEAGGYLGRTSLVTEYLGAVRSRLAIAFLPPADLGVDERRLAARGEVAICARVGPQGAPLAAGVLVHHLRPTVDGCVMRSRFWILGDAIAPRPGAGNRGRIAAAIARKMARTPAAAGPDLLVHCAQEMAHLAAFLPELRRAVGG